MSAQRRRKNQCLKTGRSAVIDVYVTFANGHEAERICATVVKERLAACANIFPVRSVYRWKNRVVKSREAAALLKTTAWRFPRLERRLKQLHSYEIPGIVAWTLSAGSRSYLKWISDTINARD